MTETAIREAALALPGVAEGTSYGTPAFTVSRKLIARFHQDGTSLVVKCDLDQREALLRARPDVFFVTDHYVGHPWVLVRMSAVTAAELSDVLEEAWRACASERLLAERM